MKVKYISQAWLVLVLALSFGAALAGVDIWLGPRIRANKLAATIEKIPHLVPGADKSVSEDCEPLEVEIGPRTVYKVFWAMDANSNPLGWVVNASGAGFADKIELLIGMDAKCEVITGLAILDQKETPGLGNKIEDVGDKDKKGFLWQFNHYGHRAGRSLTVTKASPKNGDYNKIQAVVGATISSRSVCDIVNEALTPQLRTALAAALKEGPTTRPAEKE